MSPFTLIIFGATGDLAHVKLIPGLFNLYKQHKLPLKFAVIGFARRPLTDEEFASSFTTLQDDPKWPEFANHLSYTQGMFEEKEGYQMLAQKLNQLDEDFAFDASKIFYLATPPQNYTNILNFLDITHLVRSNNSSVAIEKPFGKDLETAKALDLRLSQLFNEEQIFRVDHYLAKETIQNLLVFRFANSIFEPVWNKEFIDHVQITWAEKEGIAGRGKFFDGVGILRDVAQNHLMQMFASITMDMPKSFTKLDVREARAKTIQDIVCIKPENVSAQVVRGQYESYLHEADVNPSSQTETFTALKFFTNSPRFEGIPFYMRAGKKMKKEEMTISIVFKQTCHLLFKEIGCPEEGNILTIRIQPNEGISFRIIAKKPGTKLSLENIDMHFSYHESFGHSGVDAYQKLLLDILTGDQILFNRSDELQSSWQFITDILRGWQEYKPGLFTYKEGTWGPKEAFDLIEKDGRKWI